MPASPTPIRSSSISPLIIDPEYHYEAVNVETQQKNPHSLLWWMKRLIALRQHHACPGPRQLGACSPDNTKVLAFIRESKANACWPWQICRGSCSIVELDLSQFAGWRPIEVFGQSPFPPIGKAPYMLTLAPHTFFWFSLQPDGHDAAPANRRLPALHVERDAAELLGGRTSKLGGVLAEDLPGRAWFLDKERRHSSRADRGPRSAGQAPRRRRRLAAVRARRISRRRS